MKQAISKLAKTADTIPPHAFFTGSAIFHYLGPSFAVLLFPAVGVLGVAWFRIASAALFFAPVTKPWRTFQAADRHTRFLLVALGACLALMNTSFYLALDRLPMSLVAAMEFIGSIAVALYGLRTRRNLAALVIASVGVFVLIDVKWQSDAVGLAWSALNAVLFAVYLVLGHQIAARGARNGVANLGAAMAVAFLLILPVGAGEVITALQVPILVLAGLGVGLCSSVIPYVFDQLAMARLPRASFALMLSLLPAVATVIGAFVLAQIPSLSDLVGIGLVMAGIALHKAK